MTEARDDAPDLLHKNPEATPNDIASPFIDLYQRARHRFYREVLKATNAQSVWDAALRPKWSPADHNTVAYEDRLSKLISRSWDEVRPTVQEAAPYIEADPSLLDVHSGLAHTFDIQEGQIMPERIALFNLRLWTSQSLHWAWDHRLTGELVALFGVQSGSVQLKVLAPKPMLGARFSTSHGSSDKQTFLYADRPGNPTSNNP